MSNNQDHVWHILRDVLELLNAAGIPTPERGYALDGGWSLALSDLRRLVADRNALRVQLKTVIAERDQLRAHVERLLAGLDTARVEALWISQNTAPFGTDRGDLSTNRAARSMVAGIKLALAATPAQSLAAHDAALLRDLCGDVLFHEDANVKAKVRAEADRIEKEGANG